MCQRIVTINLLIDWEAPKWQTICQTTNIYSFPLWAWHWMKMAAMWINSGYIWVYHHFSSSYHLLILYWLCFNKVWSHIWILLVTFTGCTCNSLKGQFTTKSEKYISFLLPAVLFIYPDCFGVSSRLQSKIMELDGTQLVQLQAPPQNNLRSLFPGYSTNFVVSRFESELFHFSYHRMQGSVHLLVDKRLAN